MTRGFYIDRVVVVCCCCWWLCIIMVSVSRLLIIFQLSFLSLDDDELE